MKKIALLAACVLFSNSLFSQQWDGATNSIGHIFRSGNVSIGTNQQLDRITLSANLRMLDGRIKFGYFPPHSTGGYNGVNSYYDIQYYNNGLYFFPSNGEITIDIVTGVTTEIVERRGLFLSNSFKVGIGTDNVDCSSCADYRLFVKDGIKTEKVKVEIAAANGWADYVFKKDYKLMPLKDLQSYIDEKGHLPEVPTTEEAIANGIELKEMNILLLKKVEELTLYTLQQQRNIDEQNKRIESLEKKLTK